MQDYLKFQIGTALVKDGVCKLPYASIIEALTPAYFPEHYRFGGVAHPGTTPAKIFGPTMYVAVDVGVYNGFSNHSVGMNEVALFTSSDGGVWDKWVVVSDCCDDINYPVEPTPPGPDLSEPFTIEAKENNTSILAAFRDLEDPSATRTLLYSVDKGATWQSATIGQASATLATLNAGDTIQLKGDNFCPRGWTDVADLSGGGLPTPKPFYAYGNMMSLLSAEGFEDLTEVPAQAFGGFFSMSLVDIKNDHRLLLPATTLAESCYERMFYNCTELTSAPELPATTLAKYCYADMFSGCTNLSEVKCYAEDISAELCVSGWLDGVAATGTFYRSANNDNWTRGADGIPQGWTIVPPIIASEQ